MIQITPHMRILLAVQPADFRKGIDGLAALCRQALASDPFSGTLFVFRNRLGTAIKILVYDGQGFWLCHKRLSTGHFRFGLLGDAAAGHSLHGLELQMLLSGADWVAAQTAAAPWRPIPITG
jgi:transposase